MEKNILSNQDIQNILEKLANDIVKDQPDGDNIVILGIQRRGADLAGRIGKLLERKWKRETPVGSLDINLYRDDWTRLANRTPHIGLSKIPFQLDNKTVLLIDDVLFSGRTIRAAMEAIMDYGRPERIRLLVLVDRGHRELPISADYTGYFLKTENDWHVDVLTTEHDGRDAVILTAPSIERKQIGNSELG